MEERDLSYKNSRARRPLIALVLWGPPAFLVGLYLLLAVFLRLSSCAVSRMPVAEESIFEETRELQVVMPLEEGLTSLAARLDLIERATKSVELEFFIYELDTSSQLLTAALARKAREGVKVRLLVDFAAPVFRLAPAYARFLARAGVEVRYYNTRPLYRFLSAQHRSHRKILVVDDEAVILGGRNVADDYFEISSHYNFWDSDVLIRGPVARAVKRSFELYWSSDLTKAPEPGLEERDFTAGNDAMMRLEARLKDQITPLLASLPRFDCRDSVFATDLPGVGEGNRRVFEVLVKELSRARTEVLAESPYFVIRDGGYEVLTSLRDRGVKLRVLTNSLYSTDAFYTVSALAPKLEALRLAGMDLYAYGGAARSREHLGFPLAGRWGLHAKRAVIDGRDYMIGTYNVDPRSANLNSEMVFVCRNQPELAAHAVAQWTRLREGSHAVIQEGSLEARALLRGADAGQITRFVLALPLANFFDFLL